MVVKQLTLKQFRNYESETIELTDGINIFYGDNAQGKTNLLEGICYCATGKSHRTSNDKECIRLGAEEALIRIVYEVRGKEEKIEIHLKKSGHKTILVNEAKRADRTFSCCCIFSGGSVACQKRPAVPQKIHGYGAVAGGCGVSS